MAVTTATITNAGQTLLAGSLIGTPGQPQITYVAIGTGCGTLTNGLVNGNVYTTLQVSALPANIAAGQSLTIYDGTHNQVLTEAGGGATAGATSITVSSFTANATYAIGTGVVTTPAATDTSLFNETFRNATTSSAVGGSAGEVLLSLYIAPTDGATATYLEVGYFAGSATASLGSGTLVARALYFFSHVLGVDSAMAQLDTTV